MSRKRLTEADSFTAIDFETATESPDSACAVAMVRVERGVLAGRFHSLIRPPSPEFVFTHLHGIDWQMVAGEPRFGDLWPRMAEFLRGTPYLAAHNARFDQGVLDACCQRAGLPPPALRFECSMLLARRVLRIYPTKLNLVCQRLGIPLDHHNCVSDAEACARIVLVCQRGGGEIVSPARTP
jgi:DNA polymerase-3 subunit epsilon